MRRALPLMTLAALCAGAWPAIAGAQDRTVSLLTTGPNDRRSLIEPVAFAASADGTRTFFSTRQALVGEDSDESVDVYAREGGTTRPRRRLGRGRYILYARAYDAANQRSALRSARFTITRR